MKKVAVIVFIFCLGIGLVEAQTSYDKILYYQTSIDSLGVNIQILNPVSTKRYAKFRVKINNKNKEIVLFNPNESILRTSDRDYKTQGKKLYVSTLDKESVVVFKGTNLLIENFTYELSGLYKFSAAANNIKTNDFPLPSIQKEFNSGDFSCSMIKVNKTTYVEVTFNCLYTGNKIGIIYPDSAVIKLPDGREVESSLYNATPIVFMNGEMKKVIFYWNKLDNGKVINLKKTDVSIVWKNAFKEGEIIKMEPMSFTLKMDEKATIKEQLMKTLRSMSMHPH